MHKILYVQGSNQFFRQIITNYCTAKISTVIKVVKKMHTKNAVEDNESGLEALMGSDLIKQGH